jgi:beta-N-acetylhexosaminidase
MVAHIWFPALDARENFPASLSPNVVTGLLRGEMGYQGLIMTDALEMDAIDTVYGYGDAVNGGAGRE